MNITENNYIQQANSDVFNIEINPLPPGLDYYKESLIAAEKIESLRSGTLYAMYSGGVDSEYMISIFKKLGIEFTPVIIKFNNDYNAHDIEYALNFCQHQKLKPLIIDFDFDKFVTSGELLDISLRINSSVYHRAATMSVIGKLDGTVICGDGEPYIRLNEFTGIWEVTIYQHEYAVVNYYKSNGIYGTPLFNCYTPEMMRTFLEDPIMKKLANNELAGKLSSNSSKFIIYNRNSNFNLLSRPKYHGYEKIEQSNIFKHESFEQLRHLGKKWDNSWAEDYYTLLNRLCIQ